MAKRIIGSTPKEDGYRMPAEFEPQSGCWMIWPERSDNWRYGAKPAQSVFAKIAEAVAKYEKMTVIVSPSQYKNARARLSTEIRVLEMVNDEAWVRDCGPTFLINDNGSIRAVDWCFNACGGLYDGLYFPWSNDDQIAQKICESEGIDSYRKGDFVLEGGAIHVDGEGTVLTTTMCLLSDGRNPTMSLPEIENTLLEYLGCEKIIWLKDGIDPEETGGHIDNIACFTAPGEVACIFTDDESHPFYEIAGSAYDILSKATDAKGRKLKIHKLCLPKKPCIIHGADTIDVIEGKCRRRDGDAAIASYMNFLIINNAVIIPQFGDENDGTAADQIKKMFPGREIIGIMANEIAFGGGSIHRIVMQQPDIN